MRLLCSLVLITLSIVVGATWFSSPAIDSSRAQATAAQSAFEKREAAYRANNVGVALLEQFKAKEAVDSFTRALEIKSDLQIARINLAIAFYYLPDADAGKREAEKALTQDVNAPQPHYILGLIARAQNRFDDAVAEFQKVLKIDPDDAGSNINLGQIFVQQKKQTEAIVAFRKAIAAEPYNETALYNLGLLLTRAGQRQEGQQLIQKFQQLKASGAGIALGTNYLEGGHYAEAIVSNGAESELVEKSNPKDRFTDITDATLPPFRDLQMPNSGMLAQASGAAALFDFDGDGDLDLVEVAGDAQRLLRNDGGRFTDVTSQSGDFATKIDAVATAVIAGDYDNDGRTDLFVLRYGKNLLYRNNGGGRFSDVTTDARILQSRNLSRSVAFLDYDHDGDLDIFIAGGEEVSAALEAEKELYANPGRSINPGKFLSPAEPGLLLRNNGNGTFSDQTLQAGLRVPRSSRIVVPTDFDNRRDIDLLVTGFSATMLWRNMRDGTFQDVAAQAGLDVTDAPDSVAIGDVNKDGYADFFFGHFNRPGSFVLSDGKGHFQLRRGPENLDPKVRVEKASFASQFVDYDNDGLLDLVTVVGSTSAISSLQLRIWRNVGNGWIEVSEQIVPNIKATVRRAGRATLLAGDTDGDGDTDLIFGTSSGGLRVLRNDGGNRNRSIKVDLMGTVSNRSAIEAKVELRAGSLYQRLETYSASPAPAPADLIFGLGKRERPDAVRVIWPAGIVQSETEFPAGAGAFSKLNITELDRKPSSCPYLYTWNGKRFEFITDFMGGGEMGYLEAPGLYNKPDPTEYVRIRGDQLKAKDGRFELRVTNELEEAMFVDRLQLLAVAHPLGTEVYPNEGMSSRPKPFKLFVTRNARPPLSAYDDKGSDVLDLISRTDRRWPDDFKVDRIRGYAEEHSLKLKLAEPVSARRSLAEERREAMPERQSLSAREGGKAATRERISRTVLLLTGWTDYAWSSDNVAASQSGKVMKPPSLQVRDRAGKWRTVIEDIGIPVGRPQTVTVDLAGKFLSASREVRIVTNMRIYWDQILLDSSAGARETQITRLDPIRAELRWRGFSAEITPDGREPFGYEYQKVSLTSPWKVMTGRYTREGDVRELLLITDDMFVVSRTGDEIALSFDAMALPPLPSGWTRTFLLYADGFSKEMDINSASPDQLMPLPFHGMSRYPYRWPEQYPTDAKRRRYLEKYNTRVVRSQVPLIDTTILGR